MSDPVKKSEADGNHPSSNYLVVEDPQQVSTWHLRVRDKSGAPDHTLMGAAWAALHGGYRGNKYEGPDKQKAIEKLTALYKAEKMDTPGAEAGTGQNASRIFRQASLEAALADKGVSLETLKQRIMRAALGVVKFNTKANGEKADWVYCSDLEIPAHEQGETWCAYIAAADGRTYEQDFTITGDGVSFTGTPREVVPQTEYTPAQSIEASAQPRKHDGTFHSADSASAEADAATQTAKTKPEHLAAKKLHETAQNLHADGGNTAKAEEHRVKAKAHEDCASGMEAAKPLSQKPGDGASPPRLNALEASFDVPAPTKFDAFMVMPAGVRTVTLGRLGKAHTVTVNVNPAGARARQAHLDAVNAVCKLKAYNCFDHERKRASSHPKEYWWEDGSKTGRPAGIYESAEPTASGLDAVAGKDYQGWSETFFVDNEFAGPDEPAQLINPLADSLEADGSKKDPNDYRVMGTLTNYTAFKDN